MKPNITSSKSTNKKVPKQSVDLLMQEGRQQPARNCKNGITQGFYKVSPKRGLSSSLFTVWSLKASVKGYFGCLECKQQFREHPKLLTYIKNLHTMKKPEFACTQCKQYLRAFKIHLKQHEIDRRRGGGNDLVSFLKKNFLVMCSN